MVPVPAAVKAEMREGGSENPDYQYRCWRIGPRVDFFPMDVSNARSLWSAGGAWGIRRILPPVRAAWSMTGRLLRAAVTLSVRWQAAARGRRRARQGMIHFMTIADGRLPLETL